MYFWPTISRASCFLSADIWELSCNFRTEAKDFKAKQDPSLVGMNPLWPWPVFSCQASLSASAHFLLKLTSIEGKHQRQHYAFNILGRFRLWSQPLPLSSSNWTWQNGSDGSASQDFGCAHPFDKYTRENFGSSSTSLQQFSSKCPAKPGQLFFTRHPGRGVLLFPFYWQGNWGQVACPKPKRVRVQAQERHGIKEAA